MNESVKEQNRAVKEQILDKIVAYDRIIISRHVRPDGDALGSTKGLAQILRLTYPGKTIHLASEDSSDYLAFLGQDDGQLPDEAYKGALLIVCDTASTDRISNKKWNLADEIIKIDHHIDIKPYGDISWVEDWRSSLCEMITDFYLTFRDTLKIDREAATFLYTGMVTDSGRFRFRDVSADTMRCAAVLLEQGIDTDTLFAHLYLDDLNALKFQSYVYRKLHVTENGVAWIWVPQSMQRRFGLDREQASNVISYLTGIKGAIVSIAFIESGDRSIRVRLRSRFVTINEVAERWRGGGHACASGATLKNRREIKALLRDADAHTKAYKETHGGWL